MARGFKRQGRTVGDHFEIEFAYDFPNVGELEEMSDEEREDYFQSRLMSRYPKTGFLAPLVVKDLSLFKRLSTSVNFLQQDRECHSPNLAMWIFDVTCARLPSAQDRIYWENKIGNDWLNQKVASNPNQREAILKMLAAPDLCLIQGPPGTGKTTVIAEAIYQFAKHGERVLLASQSHDAVDNALDRLADRSEIRAVRLGERERDGEEEPSKFSRDKVLSTYYACVSNSVSQNFLSRWKENRRHYDECEKDLRDWSRVSVDLDALRRELTELDERQRQCQRDYKQAQEDLEKANVSNGNHENAKRQYRAFADMVENNADEEFYLPLEFGECLAQNLVPALNFAREKNILLASLVTAEVIQRDPNLSLSRIVKDLRQLDKLQAELSQLQLNAGADSAITQLQVQQIDEEIKRITEQMNAEDDDDKFRELSKRRKALREEKEKLRDSSGTVNLSTENLSLLAPEIQPQIQQEDARKFLLQTITEISRQCHDALQNSARRIKELLDSYQPQDIPALDERVKSYRGQIKQLDEELSRKKNEIAQKEKLGETLATKYNCAVEEIDSRIEQEMRRLDGEWENDSEIRNAWQPTLEKFAQKLSDAKTATYDASSYQEIYLNSCNVVGITCTANMREMDQLFADFDVVIIDEVSKATPPELLPPLMKARKTILVGDHRQLPPVFNEYEKSYNELLEELRARQEETDDDEEELPLKPEDFKRYEKMVTASLFKEYFERADESIKHSLLTQYRMHTDIQNVINRFYDGKLVNGIENENAARAHGLNVFTESGDTVFRPDSHAYWVDSSRLSGKPMLQSRYANSTSLHNIFEKHIILALLQKINDAYTALGVTGVTVGVISFYGSQVGNLRRAVKPLRKKWKSLKVSVNTVDRFQGKEKQIIITSLVCNTEHGNASRHVATFERINVAFSRAQNLLIIVGAKDLYQRLKVSIPSMDTGEIKSSHIYRGIINDIYANGALIPGETLIAEDSVQTIFDEYEKEAAKS